MLSYLELTNFKSFSNLHLDLRRTHGEPKKVVFIYGENGSGKSNLMSSMLFLRQSLNTLINQEKLRDTSTVTNDLFNVIADEEMQKQLLNSIIHSQFYTLSDIIEDWLYDYIVPIYNDPNLEATMRQAKISVEKKKDYIIIFPTNHGDLDINAAKEFHRKLEASKCSNLHLYIEYCLSIAERNM